MSVDVQGERRYYGGQVLVYQPEHELTFESQSHPPCNWPVSTCWTIRLSPLCGGTQVEIFHHGFERLGNEAADSLQEYEDGLDYTRALGAGHAVELPFVFGDFTTGWVLEDIYANSAEKDVLAESMMSYRTQFALTGKPGRGRDGSLPEWVPWNSDGETTLILDTPSDQGIHMISGVVTAESLKAELAADASIPTALERCARYAQMFLSGPHFDDVEFANFGPKGCDGLDPAEIRGF